MIKKKSRAIALLLSAALCAAMLPVTASAAGNAPVTWTSAIGGSTAKLVTVPMVAGRTGEISMANNSVVESAAVSTLINQKNNQANTHVVAAINGGFFNSYTSGKWSFPNSCPTVMDGIVTNNKLIHTGRSATLGFTAGGKAMVDWVEFGCEARFGNGFLARFGGGATSGSGFPINTYSSAPEAIMLFNEHMTLPVTPPAGSTMVQIRNGVVTAVESSYTFTCPKGTDIVVFNSAAAQLYREWGQFPQVGMSAKLVLTAGGTSRNSTWANVETALTGGPVLVKDGKNVVDDARNSAFYSDAKQKPDAVLARSFVGVMPSGGLVMGTVTASFRQIANWMVANGVQEGIAMDGGGSCMLYAEGAGYLSTGRNLATALTIVDRTGAGGLPAESNVGNPNGDTPSGWAAAEVNGAIAAGLVPDSLQKDYLDNISRQDFCLLIWQLVSKDPNIISKLYGGNREQVTAFTDITDQTDIGQKVCWVATLDIINGYTDGSFKPYKTLTRAEAAKILALTTQFFGETDTGEQYPFADRASFPGWAEGYIDFCGVTKTMTGVGGGAFGPSGGFTRQQAIVTMLRIYNNYLA